MCKGKATTVAFLLANNALTGWRPVGLLLSQSRQRPASD